MTNFPHLVYAFPHADFLINLFTQLLINFEYYNHIKHMKNRKKRYE